VLYEELGITNIEQLEAAAKSWFHAGDTRRHL
jgi:hypothetical protein